MPGVLETNLQNISKPCSRTHGSVPAISQSSKGSTNKKEKKGLLLGHEDSATGAGLTCVEIRAGIQSHFLGRGTSIAAALMVRLRDFLHRDYW
jgi:hypothetical protein